VRFVVFSIPIPPVLAYATDVDDAVIIIIGFPPSDKVNAASAPTDAFFILVSTPTTPNEFSSDFIFFFSSSSESLDDDDENFFLLLLVVFLLADDDVQDFDDE